MNYYNVAVQVPLFKNFIYRSESFIKKGSFVNILLGSRRVKGLILSNVKKPDFEIKDILNVDENFPPLDSARIQWIEWVSRYYLYPLGQVALLSYIEKKRNYQTSFVEKENSSILKKKLTEEQQQCVLEIKQKKAFNVHFLHGVTGSGKTEVYLELIDHFMKSQKSSLVLVPEIGLTPQLFLRFEMRFPNQVSLMHSKIRSQQRYKNWMDIVEGRKKILLGARSALFCPVSDLSLIIIDEEHETNFKQDEKLKYHCRDSAIMLAKYYNIPIVLGSATPSLESWFKIKQKKYYYYCLKNRFENRPLPKKHIIDLTKEVKNPNLPFWMSSFLFKEIEKTLSVQKQVALFLNKRGQSSLSMCSQCNQHLQCRFCDISLVLHENQFLVCHYCNYSIHIERAHCFSCKNKELVHLGIGTQRVLTDVKNLFPKAKIEVADSDHIDSHHSFKKIIEGMEKNEIDILIGTQMIAKGLDFINLDLVGIILADLALYSQDFRSSEKCYQLIVQMGGRCGRHSQKMGKVVIQTFNPDHYSIKKAAIEDFEGMAQKELEYRKNTLYPPYCRLLAICLSSYIQDEAKKEAYRVKEYLEKIISKKDLWQCLGPAPSSIFKLRSRYRYQLLIKSSSSQMIQNIGDQLIMLFKTTSPKVKIKLDRDPMFF